VSALSILVENLGVGLLGGVEEFHGVMISQQYSFSLVEEGGEDYVPSSNVEAEAAIKIIDRRIQEDSTIYTDNFKSYLGLSRLGYMHEYINHSEGEWVRGGCHINNCENRASILRLWLSIHRGICKDNLKLYLGAFKICRSNNRNHKNNSYNNHSVQIRGYV